MDISDVKKKAGRFLTHYLKQPLSLDSLSEVISRQGYTIIEFNHIYNDESVTTVITELKLSDVVEKEKGFIYVDRNHRLVFLHEDMSEDEKLMVLAHEEGHIFCEHFGHSPIIGKDVSEEYEANEFAHYILNPPIQYRIYITMIQHKKLYVAIAVLLVLFAITIASWSQITKEESYYGEFYITSTGNKYHERDCIFVKDKTNISRLTKEEFDSGEYEPCQICLPQIKRESYG